MIHPINKARQELLDKLPSVDYDQIVAGWDRSGHISLCDTIAQNTSLMTVILANTNDEGDLAIAGSSFELGLTLGYILGSKKDVQ